MLVPVERLLAGVVDTLKTNVLPEVASGFARGQLYAAIDVLQNLEDRVEEKAELHATEADSALAALARAAESLRGAGHAETAAAIEGAVEDTPAAPPQARSAGARAALGQALEAIAALPDAESEVARAALGEHLGLQAMREVAVLKPSMLKEISQG